MGCREKRIRRAKLPSGDRRVASAPIIHHKSSFINSDGFTLIELLVVISIVALLMAILLPTLQRVRKQAKAVVCQSRLRELGLQSAIYIQEQIGSMNAAPYSDWWLSHWSSIRLGRGLVLCPSAPTPLPGPPVPWGDVFHAYAFGRVDPAAPPEKRSVLGYGSYGWNAWLNYTPDEMHPWKGRLWRGPDVKGPSRVPVFFDCTHWFAGLHHLDPPPKQPFTPPPELNPSSYYGDRVSYLFIERHGQGINMVFLDWSVRRVGLKELWTLKWHKEYDTSGPWTKAGGVQPEQWPAWMRKLKDY